VEPVINNEVPVINIFSIVQQVLNLASMNPSIDVPESPLDLPLYEPS